VSSRYLGIDPAAVDSSTDFLVGVGGAYLALAATYSDKLDFLGRIPVLSLFLIVVASLWRPPQPAGSSPAASRPPSPGP
jgi:hypothetical protein